MKLRKGLLLAALGVLLLGACSAQDENRTQQKNNAGKTASATLTAGMVPRGPGVYAIESVTPGAVADFSWSENGRNVSLKELTAKSIVFLNFWATWCPPCRKELPDIVELSSEQRDVIFIGVALEKARVQDPMAHVRDFVDKNGLSYTNISGDRNILLELSRAYGINSIPTTYIFKKGGEVSEVISGSQDKATFAAAIQRARTR